jgi:transposase
VTRMANDPDTRTYIETRIKAGKTKKEAFRSLKRYIAREVYHHLPHQQLAIDSP